MKIKKLFLIIFYSLLIFILLLPGTPTLEAATKTATPKVTVTPATVTPTPVKTNKAITSSPVKTSNSVQIRDDGLTIVKYDPPKDSDQSVAYLTLILKTGNAHDPKDKAGLSSLTNELIYYLLLNTSALNIGYDTSSDFSYFNFAVASKNFNNFCNELDDIIRLDALLLYDKCNELIQFYENEPRLPREAGVLQLYQLLFGSNHPYLVNVDPDYQTLNINEVNNWFRQIYRPNNMIISSSVKLPADFLLKPSGREMAEKVVLDKIPESNCSVFPEVKFTVVRDNLASVFIGMPMPRIDEESFFAASIVQEYIRKALWTKIREDLGLCYDVQVSYSYFSQFSAPVLVISFQTLPADASEAIDQTLQILRILSKDGIRDDQLTLIKDREKNLSERQSASLKQKTEDCAFQALFNLTWLSNQDEYIKQLNQVTPANMTSLVSGRLKYLKISITGPADMDEPIKEINQKIWEFANLVK